MSFPRRATSIDREDAVLARAEKILRRRLHRHGRIDSAREAADFLRMRLAGLPHEEMHAIWLDATNRIIACDVVARGSTTGADIHLRTLLQCALRHNACAVVLAHNHPSVDPTPSHADRALTRRLHGALQMVEVTLLDHLVIGAEEFRSAMHYVAANGI